MTSIKTINMEHFLKERYWAGLWPDLVIEQVFTYF